MTEYEQERVRQLIASLTSVLETLDGCVSAFRRVQERLVTRVPDYSAILNREELVEFGDRERTLRSTRAWFATVRAEFNNILVTPPTERDLESE
jgi:hypothetical protein